MFYAVAIFFHMGCLNFGVLINHCQNVPFHCSCFLELIIVFVIHESCAAKVSHLYSGCQVFRGFCLLKDV